MGAFRADALAGVLEALGPCMDREDIHVREVTGDGESTPFTSTTKAAGAAEIVEVLVCLRDEAAEADMRTILESAGFVQDPDVLDTWFSSSLWPHSTLGWPDAGTAAVDEGQSPLGGETGRDCLSYYYPGSCLVTARDIITLWVARMHLMGLYNLGDVPFTDCFIHANILDGKGERMSKSKGNGIDPVDIIERYGADAMRYVLCEMQTGMQDIRLPVQAISPFTGDKVDLAAAKHGRSIFTYICPGSGKEFDVLGTMDDVPSAKLISDRFDVGRNFCNKLLNAARFVLMNLETAAFVPRTLEELAEEDRWILSRLARAVGQVTDHLKAYNPSAAISGAREFFWSELCDWYLELIKPRMKDEARAGLARQVLAVVLDQVLRLLHPFTPYITEMIWGRLGDQAPDRGIEAPLDNPANLLKASWPEHRTAWEDDRLEEDFTLMQGIIRAIRDIRSKYNVPPKNPLEVQMRTGGASRGILERLAPHIRNMARLGPLEISGEATPPAGAATAVVRDVEVFVLGVVDVEKEHKRLVKHRDQIAGRLEAARRKLSNENFLSKARPDVVERERERVTALETELATVEKHLRDLEA